MKIRLSALRSRLLADPRVAEAYERLGPVHALVCEIVEARHAAGLTQGEVAARLGTTQSAIARLENAHHLPSLDLLSRYAAVLGRKLDIRLAPAE